MERQHIKSFNVEQKGKNRFRFESSKQRSKKVSADVYRSYKRRFDVTSAADREESVHRPKRRKEGAAAAENDSDDDDEVYASTFAEELDLANERNGSELFGEFYREIWPLVRSVPELLHHSTLVVDLLLAYLLSPESAPHEKTAMTAVVDGEQLNEETPAPRHNYIMNHATTDVLHLLAVLAKDLQQEIHPYVYDKIMPRIIMDLLNPPPPPEDSGRQTIPLDVTIVETAFRTLSYIFQHDAEVLVTESAKEGEEPCMENMRRFYGPTLGHRRDVVRRLAAETFAPLLRKLKTDAARKKHLKRVLRALTKSSVPGGATINRAKSDAIDGVSSLLFETAKGVSGRLHSKGSQIVRLVFDYIAGLGDDFNEAVSVFASNFMQKLFRHIGWGSDRKFDDVFDELRRLISRLLDKTKKLTNSADGPALECSVGLLKEATEFRKGVFFPLEKDNEVDFETETRLKACIKVVADLTEESVFAKVPLSLSEAIVKLFFSVWNTAAKLSVSTSLFEDRLKQILQSSGKAKDDKAITVRTGVVVQSYLQACTAADAIRQAFPPIVSSVANIFDSDSEEAQTLLFRVLSKIPRDEDKEATEDDAFPSVAGNSGFSCDNQTSLKLLECCTVWKAKPNDVANLAKLGYAARCIPVLFSMVDASGGYAAEKRTLAWMLQNIKILVEARKDEGLVYDRLVPVALLVEGFSRVVSSIKEVCEQVWVKNMVARCVPLAWRLILVCPGSIWVTKSVAALCGVLPFFDVPLCDDSNVAFDILISNLRTESHFLRLYTLQILNTLPRRPYVVNHGELDLSDDLDEEPGFVGNSEQNQSGLSGCSDLISTLLKIETTTPGFETERIIAGLLTRVEVLGKSGRLPIVYAEALANHMFGVFHIKFSTLWKAVSRVICGLAKAHHTILSEAACDNLGELLLPDTSSPSGDVSIDTNSDPIEYHKLCVRWDSSGGRTAALFISQIELAQEEGRVSPFLSTDRETVLREVLRVFEAVPEITAKFSRRIVPMFLGFLQNQYYCFHDNDPDAREIRIELEGEEESEWKKAMMNRKTLQNRLLSFLRAFAAVKGSDQLYQRSLLLSVFNVNLSHQDAVVADAALTCIVNFRLPYVSQYGEQLKKILRKGELRNALLDFPLSLDNDTIHRDHRKHLLPLVERILFGRLSAASFRGTNSKDSPLARRKAIVSSLAQLESEELFPMVYLMVRNYTPNCFQLRWEDVIQSEYEQDVLNATGLFTISDFNRIPIQRHEGFLNLLSALVSQLGHRLTDYVPSFMNILIGLMKCTSISNPEDTHKVNHESFDADYSTAGLSPRLRAVKTLSFSCAAAIMDQFADVIDFSHYSLGLWEGISTAVTSLPSIVAKSGSTPSVLSLLLVLSAHDSLRPMLKASPDSVEKVIMCIGPTSEDKALDSALDFILNLMNDAASCDELIRDQVVLLLRQFKGRFSGVVDEESTTQVASKGMKITKSLSKELMVLRKIADILLDTKSISEANNGDGVQSELLNTLSSLLVQFLGHRRSYEQDHLNVLAILKALLPNIDSPTALSHFFRLSKLLSYENWSRLSGTTRREVTSTMRAISLCRGMEKSIDRISKLLENMFAMHPKRVEEMDYDRVLPAISGLTNSDDDNAWVSLVNSGSEPKFLTPLVYACFALLQQDDLVVSRSAFKALRALVAAASFEDQQHQSSSSPTVWSIFIETSVVPGARSALRSSNEQVRRHAVSLIAEVSKKFAESSSPNLHGDLNILACEENADLDFFVNILHVQSHRRCRALQRLRSRLNELSKDGVDQISAHSLSNVILPLVTFPIYESKSNLEEALAQESIATVGALGRHFSWTKYHSVLWTALNQFSRHPQQEKLIIGMICALLDSFHFDLTSSESEESRESAVWRALEKRVIPKIESLLVKEKRDRRGRTTKTIRPNVVLALLKLLKKFPPAYFATKLPRLLAIVCDALKNRESNVRDLARKAMAAITVELGTNGLSEVVKSLSVTLTEGYQLHVRSATIHSILLKLSDAYIPRQGTTNHLPEFDKCIPSLMDLVLQDMFGVASERREDGDTSRRLIKEAAGSKYLETVEIICRLLYFRPSALIDKSSDVRRSSIHTVVAPFFEKLKSDGIDNKSIEKIKRCLRSVVSGLSRNESANTDEVLNFVYSTISPILTWSTERRGAQDDAPPKPRAVVIWQPTSTAAAKNAKDAVANKFSDQTKLATVKDGASAPRLTGTGRHAQMKHSNRLNSPANACATEFGLNMLLTTTKNAKKSADSTDLEAKLTPFLTLLTTCVCDSRDNVVTLLSIRCIALLLKKGIRPAPEVFSPLGAKIIDILSTGEAVVGINQDLTQVCMVALTTLLKLQIPEAPRDSALAQKESVHGKMLSLTGNQMTVLVSLLKESVATFEDSNASLGVIKALLAHRLMSPELYDLMEKLLHLSVRSHRESFRDQCCNIFITFLVEYPISTKRFEQHLRQVMLNIKYEHREGRKSAIRMVSSLVDRLPLELVDNNIQLIFLPLVLQLVNDDAEDCRKAVSTCLERITCRVSGDVASSLYDYNLRWYKGDNASLRRASLQLFGIFAEGRSEILAQNTGSVMACLRSSLESEDSDWEQHYFSLVSVEKVVNKSSITLEEQHELWSAILSELSHPHLWVRMTASRVIGYQLEQIHPKAINKESSSKSFLVVKKGSLYDLASNFCGHLDAEESNMSTELSELAIKSLTWIALAMESNPELCYADGEAEGKEPVKWLINRLSGIARRKGTLRRQGVFKCFAALFHAGGSDLVLPYLHLIIEPLYRAMLEAAGTRDTFGSEKFSKESDLAKEVLGMFEESCGDVYLTTLASVKVQARERRDKRKDKLAAEAVADPAAFATKKIHKQVREKHRRKRRVEEHRNDRGARAKRRTL